MESRNESERGSVESTVYHHGVEGELLKDTVIYCTAEKYGLEELKRVALRKQGLREYSYPTLPLIAISDIVMLQNLVYSAALFCHPLDMPTQTLRTRTPN